MASNLPSGVSTPNPRFTPQAKTAEDLLSTQTVGLVALSDFRKRRAEAIEQKERDVQDTMQLGGSSRGSSGTTTPSGVSVMNDSTKKTKKKRKVGVPKLSFGFDEEEAQDNDTDTTPNSTRDATPTEGVSKKIGVNTSLSVVPKALTKSALLREAQTRESLRKEFMLIQESVKATEVYIPFVFYDGTNIPGGMCKVKKGDYIWVFLDRSRKVGAELGVGEKVNSRREWAKIGVDDLMLVRGNLIIPHHYDFYYFIINKTRGPNNRILFDYSSDVTTAPNPPAEPIDLDTYNPLSQPKDKTQVPDVQTEDFQLEGMEDDATFTKVVDRRWYERNKHIFPASVWQDFDPEKDYQKEVKRDLGGNAFFFS